MFLNKHCQCLFCLTTWKPQIHRNVVPGQNLCIYFCQKCAREGPGTIPNPYQWKNPMKINIFSGQKSHVYMCLALKRLKYRPSYIVVYWLVFMVRKAFKRWPIYILVYWYSDWVLLTMIHNVKLTCGTWAFHFKHNFQSQE